MLWSTLTIVVAVVAFAMGWFRGYKTACHAHGWTLPRIEWKRRARSVHRA
jgi:hypothetical protein